MSYSMDLRTRIVEFVSQGGSTAESSRRFQVSLWCIHDWMKRKEDLTPRRPGPKAGRKLDWNRLRKMVEAKPDLMLKELAERFNVTIPTIAYALRQMKISRKKKRHVTSKKGCMKVGDAGI